MKVPKLRFPEFRDAGEWEEKQIGDYFKEVSRILEKPSKTYTGLGIRSHGKGTFLKLEEDPVKNMMDNLFKVEKNDLIVNITFAWEGAIAIATECDDGALVSHRFPTYVSDNSDTVINFFRYITTTNKFFYKLFLISPGGAGRNRVMNKKDFLKIKVLTPRKSEQQKIADCLSSLDELIAAHNQKLAALKLHKKGLMQQLFPAEGETVPRLRFPEFRDAGEWEERSLGKICDVRDGTHDSPQYYPCGKPLITSKNLLSNGLIDFNNVNFISEEDFQKIEKRSAVAQGDILLGMIGTIGNPVIARSGGFAIKNVALMKQQKELLNRYLLQFLSSQYIESKFRILNTGNSQKFISLGQIRALEIIIPSIPEQEKIADCLSSLDDLIAAQSQKIEAFKTHKKGLMQQLFPAADEAQG